VFVLIDNYDSFTYNLVQMLESMGKEVAVYRNDQISLEELKELSPSALMVSPGPCTPEKAGISVEVISYFGSKIPVMGVCLGHQSIAAAYGGKVVRADRIMHGKSSAIFHDNSSLYKGLPNPFEAIRYHSLIVEESSLPDCLQVSAWTEEGEIMGLRHRKYPVEGVQFHPESILTHIGADLITNFIGSEALTKGHKTDVLEEPIDNKKGGAAS
jgi:anthranilate synthase/aminodeoxychorismate synthase-like glutamine amidotransferase